jgi:hypothetical protein
VIWTCFKSRAIPACTKRCCFKELVISSHRDLGASRACNAHNKHWLFLYTTSTKIPKRWIFCALGTWIFVLILV